MSAIQFAQSADMVNHPPHYNAGTIEVIDIIESITRDMKGITAVCAGNTIKYIARHPYKGTPLQDLRKAQWYLNKMIEQLEKGE
jgi:hypothetical protein